tara:strand:+ start:2910 stop:4103 length:1194 start_codon:yes stop_codon:yes gene_type:complete
MTKNKSDSLAKASKELMMIEPFYGFFLIMLNKIWTKTQVPTAGVCKNGINYQLCINEDFWDSLDKKKELGILKHELLHVAFNHLTHFYFPDKRLANIAMDMEINQYIDKTWLPEDGIFIENYADLELDYKAGCKYYYKKLQEAKEEKEQNGTSGCEEFDRLCDQLDGGEDPVKNHDMWKDFQDLSETEKKLIEKQIKRVLTQASDIAESKSRGCTPGEIKDLIKVDEVLPPKFDWKNYVRRFSGTSSRVFTRKLRRKENRKFEDNPGLKIKMKKHVLLAIDTSGSVSNEEVKEFMGEMKHIHKTGVAMTLAQCDTSIRKIEPYNGSNELNIEGRGGTEFDPVLDYFNANLRTYTSLIYFTDGECYTSVKPQAPVLWVLSECSSMNDKLPGKVIKLEL